MNSAEQIKDEVKNHYGSLASSCCGKSEGGSCCTHDYSQEDLAALPDGADLGLGCGNPVTFSGIKEGDTVLDLGSGAGIDVFLAAQRVGPAGKAIGVDMTPAMIARAEANAVKIRAANVEFRLGEIESLPVEDAAVDFVISNCVINLVPSKEKAFGEVFRVLKPGGRFTVSDIVMDGMLSDEARSNAALWAGCVSGAVERRKYIDIITGAGFRDVRVLAERKSDARLENAEFVSMTVTGTKP